MTLPPYDLIVLAGGSAERLGGTDKAEVVVAGVRLLDRALAATPGAGRRVVVGPTRPTTADVTWCREHPPGGGPVAGLAAGLRLVDAPYAIVLAVDLPLVDSATVARLLAAAVGHGGAIGIDPGGRRQPLLAAYQTEALSTVLAELDPLASLAMRAIIARLDLVDVQVGDAALDCDTWADVARAETAFSAARPTGPGPPLADESTVGDSRALGGTA